MSKRDTYGFEIIPTEDDENHDKEAIGFQKRNRGILKLAEQIRNGLISIPEMDKYSNLKRIEYASFFSDGTRIAATIWKPNGLLMNKEGKFPAILLVHGLGGIRAHLDARYAPMFCDHGFVVLTFDYRGWGDSDGVIIQSNIGDLAQKEAREQDMQDQKLITKDGITAHVIRQRIDMSWQIKDISSAMRFLESLPFISTQRIGIWGTSQGGGHVITYAGMDRIRVNAVVSQAPSIGYRGFGAKILQLEESKNIATKEVLKGLRYGVRGHHLPAADGVPDLESMRLYDPRIFASAVQAPTCIIDCENEELWDRLENGRGVFNDLLNAKAKEYHLLPGLHYEIYDKQREEALKIAVAFFEKYLMESKSKL